MPFDPISFKEKFPFIPSKEGLRVLARALRAPLPLGFTWDFGETFYWTECGSAGCAMGLAKILWPEQRLRAYSRELSEKFQIPEDDATKLFVPLMGSDKLRMNEVTPTVIADVIDRYLDTGEIWPADLRP